MTIDEIRTAIEARKARSAWSKGVNLYAFELLDSLEEAVNGGWEDSDITESPKLLYKAMLNGAPNWIEFSWGGCSLIYNGDIAKRLCTPYELKKTQNGERRPNPSEQWLDTQARALTQASNLILSIAKQS